MVRIAIVKTTIVGALMRDVRICEGPYYGSQEWVDICTIPRFGSERFHRESISGDSVLAYESAGAKWKSSLHTPDGVKYEVDVPCPEWWHGKCLVGRKPIIASGGNDYCFRCWDPLMTDVPKPVPRPDNWFVCAGMSARDDKVIVPSCMDAVVDTDIPIHLTKIAKTKDDWMYNYLGEYGGAIYAICKNNIVVRDLRCPDPFSIYSGALSDLRDNRDVLLDVDDSTISREGLIAGVLNDSHSQMALIDIRSANSLYVIDLPHVSKHVTQIIAL